MSDEVMAGMFKNCAYAIVDKQGNTVEVAVARYDNDELRKDTAHAIREAIYKNKMTVHFVTIEVARKMLGTNIKDLGFPIVASLP